MSWGNSFAAGLSAGATARDNYKRRKFDDQRLAFEKEIRDRELNSAADRYNHDREFRERTLADAAARWKADREFKQREFDATAERYAADKAAREADPVLQLSRAKAQRELAAMGQPDELADLTRQRDLAARKRELETLSAPPAPPAQPMAKVTQKFGDTTVVRDMPASDFERSAGALGYRSPYADDIAGFDRQISEQQAEIAGGDTRTGFLGIGTSRESVINKARQQRLYLKAQELQDMLEKGIIDEAEADRRAALLQKQ